MPQTSPPWIHLSSAAPLRRVKSKWCLSWGSFTDTGLHSWIHFFCYQCLKMTKSVGLLYKKKLKEIFRFGREYVCADGWADKRMVISELMWVVVTRGCCVSGRHTDTQTGKCRVALTVYHEGATQFLQSVTQWNRIRPGREGEKNLSNIQFLFDYTLIYSTCAGDFTSPIMVSK